MAVVVDREAIFENRNTYDGKTDTVSKSTRQLN